MNKDNIRAVNSGCIRIPAKQYISELLFYIFFSLMFGMRMWGIYEGEILYIPFLVMGMLFWGISIITSEHTLFEYLIIIVLMTLSGIIYYNSGEKGLILYFALMLGMKGVNVKRLFLAGLTAGLSGIAVRSFLASFGLLEDVTYLQTRRFVGEIFRRSLGASHPNTLSSSFTILAIMVLFLIGHNNKRRIWSTSSLVFIIACYVYLYSGSRTGLFILVGYMGLNLIYAHRQKTGKLERLVLLFVFPAIWLFSIVGPMFATDGLLKFVEKIDTFLRSRWYVAIYYLENNNLSLFGQRLNNPATMHYGIDMSQLYLLLQLGTVAFIVVTALWIMTFCYEIKNDKCKELVITFSMLIMGITDPFLYNLGFKNLAFVFMGEALFFYINRISDILPAPLNKSFGGKKLNTNREIPILPGIDGLSDKNIIYPSWHRAKIFRNAVVVVLLFTSIAIYLLTPDPSFVLTDRNTGEAYELAGMIGRTYSQGDIQRIKNDGNIVLNYTDDNELMYTYYSSLGSAVAGGYYAPNAALLEKVRLCVSIFFWGTVLAFLAYKLVLFFRAYNRESETERVNM